MGESLTSPQSWLPAIYRNPAAIFLISMTLGLTVPGPAAHLRDLISVALIVMMTFSLTGIDIRMRWGTKGSKGTEGGTDGGTKESLKEAALGFMVNYALLTGLILFLSWGIEDQAIRRGFIVMAAVPPAVSIVPLTKLLGGDVGLALRSTAVSYLAALVLMPWIIFAFTSETGVGAAYTLGAALAFILLPLILSRPARKVALDPIIPINMGFFVVTYTVIGLNSAAIFHWGWDLAWIGFARTFVMGTAVCIGAMMLGAPAGKRTPYTLLASYKNLGLAAVVAIVLFGPEAAIPSGVCILAENAYYMFLYVSMYAARRCAARRGRRGSLI